MSYLNETQVPKILIISHNLYDVTNNIGKTLVALFDDWPKEKIAQIYFRNDLPSFKYCEQYFCITDKDVLKSAVSFGKKEAGIEVKTVDSLELSNAEVGLYQVGNHRHPSVSLMRDTLWELANWRGTKLEEWVRKVNPDIILFVPNDYCLAYEVALYVQNIVRKPIIPFYMDDSFYYNCSTTFIDKYRRRKLRKLAQRVHQNVNKIFTICDYMSSEYEQVFKKKCQSFVNCTTIETISNQPSTRDVSVISYLGNLHSNRWKSLVEIGQAIDCINEEEKRTIELRIYSGSLLERKVKKEFNKVKCIRFLGRVDASQVREKQCESDILLHVEAFDRGSVNSTRLSLSTKIPEYLGTAVCVFAYGPQNIASLRYLSDNTLAQVCYFKTDIKEKLLEIIDSVEKRNEYQEKGVRWAAEYHDIRNVCMEFQKTILEAWGDSGIE